MIPALLTIGFICFAALAFYRLDIALAVLVFLLPSYRIRFSLGPLPLTALEVLILICSFVWIIKLVQKKYSFPAVSKLLLYPALAFLLSATFAVFVSPDIREALGAWKAYFIEPFLFFVVCVSVVRTPEQIRRLLYALGFSALLISIFGIIQYITTIGLPASWLGNSIEPRRIVSVFDYPNALALYLAPIIALFAGLLLPRQDSRPLLSRLFAVVVVATSLVAIFLTFSRGGWLGVLAGFVVIGVLSSYRKYVVGLLLALVLIVVAVPSSRERVLPLLQGKDVSSDVRLVLWQGSWNIVKARPVLGAGLSGFRTYYAQYKLPQHIEILNYPHNIVLNFWLETTIFGLASFVWLLVAWIVLITQTLRSDSSRVFRALLIGLAAAIAAIVVHGFVDVPYLKNDLAVQFWLFVAFTVISQQIIKSSHSTEFHQS